MTPIGTELGSCMDISATPFQGIFLDYFPFWSTIRLFGDFLQKVASVKHTSKAQVLEDLLIIEKRDLLPSAQIPIQDLKNICDDLLEGVPPINQFSIPCDETSA